MPYKLTTGENWFTETEADKLSDLGFEFYNVAFGKHTKKIVDKQNYINIVDMKQLNEFVAKYGDIAIYKNSDGYEISIIRVK